MSNVVRLNNAELFPIFTMIDENQLMGLFANFDVNNSYLNDRADKFVDLMFPDHEDKEWIRRWICCNIAQFTKED